MNIYEDAVVTIDDELVTIKSYRYRNDAYRIPLHTIRSVEHFAMGFWSGKYRVVGMGFGRLRSWFARGRSATNRTHAISLDIGRVVKPTFVPDDPQAVEDLLDTVRV